MKKKIRSRIETAGRIIGVVYVIIWVVFFLFQTTGGNFNSFIALIPPAIMLLLLMVANQNLLAGGISLLVAGSAIAVRYGMVHTTWRAQLLNGALTGGVYLVVGMLCLIAWWMQRRS